MAGSADLTGNNGVAVKGAEVQVGGLPRRGPRSTTASASTAWAAS